MAKKGGFLLGAVVGGTAAAITPEDRKSGSAGMPRPSTKIW